MGQIIKHRRGTASQLSSYTLQKGEIGVTTGSVSGLTTPILHIGNGSQLGGYAAGRLLRGATVPNVSSLGSVYNDLLFHDTDDKILYRLNGSGGNENLDITGNLAGRTITGTLTVTGQLSSQAHISTSGHVTASNIYASGNIRADGTITIGDSADDSITINADITSDLLPNASATFDLGSSSKKWNDLHVGTVSASFVSASQFFGNGAGLTGVSADFPTTHDTGISHNATKFSVNDGANKFISGSQIQDYVYGSISSDATVAAGGALTIANDAVNNNKLANMTRGTVKVGGGSNAPTDLDAKTSGQILVGDGTDIVSVAVSGDITLAANGTMTIAANSVALSTDTTGDYVESLTAGALIDLQNNSGEGATPTIDVDLTEAGEAAIANGDYILFLDGGATGTHAKEAIADVATLFAGAGMTATNSVMNVIGGDGITANADEIEVAVDDSTIELSATNGSGEIRVKNAGIDENKLATSVAGTGIAGGGGTALSVAFSELTSESPTFSNLTLTGNLNVKGTQTIVSSSEVNIGDNIITVNVGGAATEGGLNVVDATGTAHTGSILWNNTGDYWFTGVSGSTHYRLPQQAGASALTDNKVLIADSNGRIESSANITDNGSTIDVNDVDITSVDKLEGVDANTFIDLGVSDTIDTKGNILPNATNADDLGSDSKRFKDFYLEGNADIDGTLNTEGAVTFQGMVNANASLFVTGSIHASAGASVASNSGSAIAFRNTSTKQLGFLSVTDQFEEMDGIIGYDTSGNLTVSSVIDGGSF